MDNSPATRLWFPSRIIPNAEDFEGEINTCDFPCLQYAVEDAGDAIRKNNRPADCDVWIRHNAAILDERQILTRYDHSLDRPRDHNPLNPPPYKT